MHWSDRPSNLTCVEMLFEVCVRLERSKLHETQDMGDRSLSAIPSRVLKPSPLGWSLDGLLPTLESSIWISTISVVQTNGNPASAVPRDTLYVNRVDLMSYSLLTSSWYHAWLSVFSPSYPAPAWSSLMSTNRSPNAAAISSNVF